MPEEDKRLAALHTYSILDTLPEADYDDFTKLAAQICQTPAALITLVDQDRQWFKSTHGFPFRQTPRELSFCAHNLIQPRTWMVVKDARQDKRFAQNPLVTGEPRIVFYAGVPLVTEEGNTLGSLCVIDQQTRQLSPEQLEALRILGKQVMNLLALRKANRTLAARDEESRANLEQQRLMQRALTKSEDRFREMVQGAPVAMAIFQGPAYVIQTANRTYQQIVNRGADELMGKPMFEAMPEVKGQGLEEILADVLTTGEPYQAKEVGVTLYRGEQLKTCYFDFVYQPLRDETEAITGVSLVAIELTEQRLIRQQLADSEELFRSLVENTPDVISRWDRDRRLVYANTPFAHKTGVSLEAVYGKTNAEMGQPDQVAGPYMEALQRVIDTARPIDHYNDYPTPSGHRFYHSKLVPEFDTAGKVQHILAIARDITELKASEARFRLLIEEAPLATSLFVGRELRVAVANQPMLDIWGKGPDQLGRKLADILPEIANQPFLAILDKVYTSGQTFSAKGARADLLKNDVLGAYYFDFIYKPLFDANGAVYAILQMASDVTDQVQADQLVARKEADLRNAVELADLGTWYIDLVGNQVHFSDRVAEWFAKPSGSELSALFEVVPPRDALRMQETINAALTPGADGLSTSSTALFIPSRAINGLFAQKARLYTTP